MGYRCRPSPLKREAGAMLVEAALAIILLSMVMIGGNRIIQHLMIEQPLIRTMNIVSQLYSLDDLKIKNCQDWGKTDFCRRAAEILQHAQVPLCAVTITIDDYKIEEQDIDSPYDYNDTLVKLSPMSTDVTDYFPDWYDTTAQSSREMQTTPRLFFQVEVGYNLEPKSNRCGEKKIPPFSIRRKLKFPLLGGE